MSQLRFTWDVVLSTPTPTTTVDRRLEPKRSTSNSKAAERCRKAADAMQKHIDIKHSSANAMLAKPPTRKRFQDADSIRREAIRLERIQSTLRKLAEMHEAGTIRPELASLTSRLALEDALLTESGSSAIHAVYRSAERAESKSEQVRRLTSEAMLLRIPGFFPTPPELVEEFIRFAGFANVSAVLEPSAGTGSLIDAILKRRPEAQVFYVEINCFLLEVLRLKYEGMANLHFVGRDFEEVDPRYFDQRFDCILLNPPFERGQDMDHVVRAHQLLSPGGTLAAIMSEGAFSRTDQKAAAFREFLESTGATSVKLPADSFKSSGTAVACRFVRISR